jgi:hypothetical protein
MFIALIWLEIENIIVRTLEQYISHISLDPWKLVWTTAVINKSGRGVWWGK